MLGHYTSCEVWACCFGKHWTLSSCYPLVTIYLSSPQTPVTQPTLTLLLLSSTQCRTWYHCQTTTLVPGAWSTLAEKERFNRIQLALCIDKDCSTLFHAWFMKTERLAIADQDVAIVRVLKPRPSFTLNMYRVVDCDSLHRHYCTRVLYTAIRPRFTGPGHKSLPPSSPVNRDFTVDDWRMEEQRLLEEI